MGVACLRCRENPEAYMNRLQYAAVTRLSTTFLDPGSTSNPEESEYREAEAQNGPVAHVCIDGCSPPGTDIGSHDFFFELLTDL
jgi:hypothetical protein